MTDERDPKDPPDKDADDDARARALVKKALAKRSKTPEIPVEDPPALRGGGPRSPSAELPPQVEDVPDVDKAEAPVSATLTELGAQEPEAPTSSVVVIDDVDLKDALRGALRPPAGSVAPNLLKGVQRKLRVRSRGKFYGDGWSTAESPKATYLITAIIMLVLIAVLFFALVPWSSSSL